MHVGRVGQGEPDLAEDAGTGVPAAVFAGVSHLEFALPAAAVDSPAGGHLAVVPVMAEWAGAEGGDAAGPDGTAAVVSNRWQVFDGPVVGKVEGAPGRVVEGGRIGAGGIAVVELSGVVDGQDLLSALGYAGKGVVWRGARPRREGWIGRRRRPFPGGLGLGCGVAALCAEGRENTVVEWKTTVVWWKYAETMKILSPKSCLGVVLPLLCP